MSCSDCSCIAVNSLAGHLNSHLDLTELTVIYKTFLNWLSLSLVLSIKLMTALRFFLYPGTTSSLLFPTKISIIFNDTLKHMSMDVGRCQPLVSLASFYWNGNFLPMSELK